MKSFDDFMDAFYEFFDNLPAFQKTAIWNIYQKEIDGDDEFYDNDEEFVNSVFSTRTPYEIAQSLEKSCWCDDSDYVFFDEYGNLISADEQNLDSFISVDEMAEYAYDEIEFLYKIKHFDEGVSELIEFLEDIN